MAVDWSQFKPDTTTADGSTAAAVDWSQFQPAKEVGGAAMAGRQFVAGGGDLLNTIDSALSALNPASRLSDAALLQDAQEQLAGKATPEQIAQLVRDQQHPLQALADNAHAFGELGPGEVPEGLGARIAGGAARVLPNLAGAIATGGESALPEMIPQAVRGIPLLGRTIQGIASGAPTAAVLTTEQAANLPDNLTPVEKAEETAKAAGINLGMAGLPVAAGKSALARAVTGGAIGYGATAGTTALDGGEQDQANNLVGAITGALLGQHSMRHAPPEVDPFLAAYARSRAPGANRAPANEAEIDALLSGHAGAKTQPLALPAGDTAIPGEARVVPRRPAAPAADAPPIRVTPQGEAATPQQGAQALGDLLRQAAEGASVPQLPAPTVAVDRAGNARTSADFLAQVRAAQADAEARQQAAVERRALGITPDIEHTQGPRWQAERARQQDMQDRQDAIDAQHGELVQQGTDDAPPWWMGARGGELDHEAQRSTSGFSTSNEATAPAPRVNLDAMRNEIGWDQQGGRLLRQFDEGGEKPEVVGRTTWVPKAGQDGEESAFWRMRPERGGKISEAQAHAALDKYAEGQPLNARERRFIDYATETQRQYDDAYDAQLREFEQDRTNEDAANQLEARQALQAEAIPPADHTEALTIDQLVRRAHNAGADASAIIDATWDGSPAEQARRLWDLTRQLEERHGTDNRANPQGRGDVAEADRGRPAAAGVEPEGERFGLANPEPPRAEAPRQVTQQSGLFTPPTPADHIRAATEARDAGRNGRTGGRVDAGDGGLFDGPRPQQVDIEGEAGRARANEPKLTDFADEPRQRSIARGNEDADHLGLRAAVREALGPVADRVEYLHGYEGLPEKMRRGVESRNALGRKGVTAAMYSPDTGRVFIFTQVTKTPARAVWHAAHEIAGHEGLRELLGDRLDPALNIARQNPTVKALADEIYQQRKIAEQMKKAGRPPGDGFLLATEEALAELAAAVRTGNYEHIADRYGVDVKPSMRESVKAAIANFLRRLKAMIDDLFGKHVFTDQDVRSLLEAAWQAAKNKGATEVEPQSALDSVEDQTDTPAFRKWFGDSKVVDADGKPLVVYHGTRGDFDRFDTSKSVAGSGAFYFSPNPDGVNGYAGNGSVMPVFLSLQNPYMADGYSKYDFNFDPDKFAIGTISKADVDALKARGYDGMVLNRPDRPVEFAAFDPSQIKSASGNRGTFDPSSPSILESTDYTPEQKEFMRKAGMAGAVDERTGIKRALDGLRDNIPHPDADVFRQGAIDKFHGLKRAVDEKGGIAPEDNPYLAAEMIQTASTMEAILRFGAPELHQGALRVKRDVPGLLDALTPVRDQMPQWLGWMVARRAKVLQAQGRENALSDTDIQAGLSLATGHEAEFKGAALGYLKLKNTILDLAEQTGIIDPEARKAWDHAEYIPFYRDMDAGFSGPGTRQGLANQSSGIRTLKGGESPLKDPLGNIIANFTRLVDSSMKNRATLLAVDQLGAPYFRKAPLAVKAETIPLDQVKKHLLEQGVDKATIAGMPADALKGVARMLAVKAPEGEDIVRVMRGGKAEYYHVDDPLLLRSLTAFNEGGTHWSIKPLVWFKQLLTAGATATPDFLIRNALRDTGEASVTSKDRFVPMVDTVRGAIDSFRESELAQDLMMAGAAFHGGLFHTGNNEDTAKAIKRALRKHGLTDSAIERYVRTLINPKRLWDMYRSVSEATEMGSRVSLARKRLAAGATPVEAAHEAKDFLNFQRRGDDKFVLAFTKMIPFLNARVQGADRLYRVGTTKGRRGKVAARLAMMAMLTTLLYWWNQEEYKDAYDEIPDWDKDANWHIAPGTDHHLRIPKPFELGLVGGTVPERMYGALRYQLTNGEEGDRPAQSWDAFMRGLGSALGINPIPQAAMPIVEDIANKSLYFDTPIESMGDRYKAPSDRFGPTTSPTMRAASKGMAALFGEDRTLSPKRLEHFWTGYTAGMGRYLLDGADWVVRKLEHAPEQPALTLRDFPLVGTVARGGGPARSTRYVDEFYDLAEQAQVRSGAVKDAVHNGDTSRAARIEKEWGWLIGQREGSKRAKEGFMHSGLRALNRTRDQLSAISKDNARIYADRTMSGEAKRKALDANLEKRNALVRKVVRQLREAERKSRG